MKPYFEEDGITIYNADCREVLPTLEPVDVVITDPPYSDWVHARVRRGGSFHAPDATEGVKRAVISTSTVLGFNSLSAETRAFTAKECRRLAKRWTLIFSDLESAHEWRDDLTAAGLEYVRTGIWVKLGATPQFTGDRPAMGFETITIAHPRGRKRWNGGGIHGVWQYPIVLNRSHTEPRLHTTQKPLGLMLDLVDLFSNKGETILDMFAGSGTTLVAAKAFWRRAIGIEMNESDCEKAAMRIQKQPALADHRLRWPRKSRKPLAAAM